MAEHKSNNEHARRIRELKAELKREEQALEASRASRFGEDIYVTGDVLRFDKSFAAGETYPYAAIKTRDGYWRTCGPTAGGKAWSWSELISWLNSGTPVKELRVVTSTRQVVPAPKRTRSFFDGLDGLFGCPVSFSANVPSGQAFVFHPEAAQGFSNLLFDARECSVYGCDKLATRVSCGQSTCAGHSAPAGARK